MGRFTQETDSSLNGAQRTLALYSAVDKQVIGQAI
jgi:hypothetical protein